jgi:hypothetical protein
MERRIPRAKGEDSEHSTFNIRHSTLNIHWPGVCASGVLLNRIRLQNRRALPSLRFPASFSSFPSVEFLFGIHLAFPPEDCKISPGAMQRPTSATVFGILNIAFAAYGVFGIIASAMMLFSNGNSNNPVVKIMHENPGYLAWMKLTVPLGLIGCVVLLVAGIGLLKMKEWARKLSIGYAIYAILFGLAGSVVTFLYLVRPMIEQASHQHGPEAAGMIGGAVGGLIGSCFGMIYPILTLVFLTRPKLRVAFQHPSGPPPFPS